MRRIKLTRGFYALVDNEDYDWLKQIDWVSGGSKPRIFAATYPKPGEIILMSRIIMNAPDELDVDHINGKTLDNQRHNLRLCTHQQNQMNRRLNVNNKSGYKGVYYKKDQRKKHWRARIQSKHLGYFATPEEAAREYDKAALERYGEFACTNDSMGLFI